MLIVYVIAREDPMEEPNAEYSWMDGTHYELEVGGRTVDPSGRV